MRYLERFAQQLNRLVGTELINQRMRSCSSDIKSAVAFLNGFLPLMTDDPGFQFLDFLLLGRKGLL